MKAYAMSNNHKKGVENIQLLNLKQPTPHDDLILVKVKSVGLNPVDYKLALDGNRQWSYPHVLGVDVAGEIVALGNKVRPGFRVGDRVCGHANVMENGTFAEYVLMHDYSLAIVPETVTFEKASAVLCGGMSAYQALFRKSNIVGKSTILIHGGAGGVGLIAIQLAKKMGLTVLTTVSSYKVDFVIGLGADFIIDYQTEDVSERVMEITHGQGVDISINVVSPREVMKDIQERLAYNGQVISLLGLPNRIDVSWLDRHGITVSSLNLGGVHQFNSIQQKNDLATMAQELVAMIANEELDPKIERVLPFDELIVGLKMIENHEIAGKIVVRVG